MNKIQEPSLNAFSVTASLLLSTAEACKSLSSHVHSTLASTRGASENKLVYAVDKNDICFQWLRIA